MASSLSVRPTYNNHLKPHPSTSFSIYVPPPFSKLCWKNLIKINARCHCLSILRHRWFIIVNSLEVPCRGESSLEGVFSSPHFLSNSLLHSLYFHHFFQTKHLNSNFPLFTVIPAITSPLTTGDPMHYSPVTTHHFHRNSPTEQPLCHNYNVCKICSQPSCCFALIFGAI